MPSPKIGPLTGQKKAIYNHLLEHGNITSVEALIRFRCFRLAARILDLRNHGYAIRTERITDPLGAKYARYHLEKKNA
jgi:hypothetical protein